MSAKSLRVKKAIKCAREDSARLWVEKSSCGHLWRHRVVIGDPQAPLATFLTVLDSHALLGEDGRLAPDVHLVSLGDHFDWGRAEDRPDAAEQGLQLLSWLAIHPADQVGLILGNHDLARVGELAGFDDSTFSGMQREADALYQQTCPDSERESALLAQYPSLPSVESAARDFATFLARQRELVTALLHARRFRVALAEEKDLLLCHAGVTQETVLGDSGDARLIAAELNRRLDNAVAHWQPGTPLHIEGLHQPGNATEGAGRGIFSHRPAQPQDLKIAPVASHKMRRRFDPRRLPPGLTQVIGHTRDLKCRQLLRDWCVPGRPTSGKLRHLCTNGSQVRYTIGLPPAAEPGTATLIFADGSMSTADPHTFELYDLARRQVFTPSRATPTA